MSAKEITQLLTAKYGSNKFVLCNVFVFSWESDFFVHTQSDYRHEFEVKISRADFFKDTKKKRKFELLSKPQEYSDRIPNKFTYVVPKGLVTANEVPEFAGLIYVTERNEIEVVKRSPFIHKEKPNKYYWQTLAEKFYTYWNEK